jgi:uncharacterized phiE125 gp8 family phage protein
MQYRVVTAVATEPVSLAEARLQCKVSSDDTTHDAVLTALITAAREYAQHHTGRALAEQTLEAALDAFPSDAYIDLPLGPVATITHIKYTDTAGAEQTLSSASYALSTYGTSRRINLAASAEWPSTQDVANAVRARYVTGYGVTAGPTLPKAVKAALLLHIEMESPINPLSPAERESMGKARDSLLDTVKDYGA